MPSLSDIFNPSFFMCLGILVLLTALIVVYFESKMREQNHKIASMLSLVSSLAEEQNNLRMEVFRMVTTGQTNSVNNFPVNSFSSNSFPVNNFNNKNDNNDLINVSDDEDDESDDDDDVDDDESDVEDSEEDDSDSDLEENEIIEIGENDVKILKININNKDSNDDDEFNIEQIDDLEELGENSDDDDESSVNDLNDIDDDSSSSDDELNEETIVPDNLEETKEDGIIFEETPKIDLNKIDFKQISISGLEKDANDTETMDYKKLSLNKLKSLVVEKGLTKDSSKLKKNELLNLLGVK